MTPTEQRIMSLLEDGFRHSVKELQDLIDDDLAQKTAIANHISRLRKKLPEGYQIFCVSEGRRRFYILARYQNQNGKYPRVPFD